MDLFYGIRGTGTIELAGSGWLEDGVRITARVQPRQVAPGGLGREVSFGPLWVMVRHDGPCRLTLTPIVDGTVRTDLEEVYEFAAATAAIDELVKLTLSDPLTWPGAAEPFSRQALRGVWFSVRAELMPLVDSDLPASLRVDPAGAENALLYTAVSDTSAGNLVTIKYDYPGTFNAPLSILVSDSNIWVSLATDGVGVITTTAAAIKTAIEASVPASALVTVSIPTDDGGVGDGSGLVTAMPVTYLSGGGVFALGGLELEAVVGGTSGPSIPAP